MTPKDEWVLTNKYEKLDIVTVTEENQTSAYIAKEDIPANTEITDSKWMKLFTVTNGVDGTNGTNGSDGANGADGADGKSITAITLTKDATGAITGGTATLSDTSQINITVTTVEA